MSSLPKRSGSNCSFSKGDDEISVRKIQDDAKDVEGRKSGVESIRSETSSSPSLDAGDIAIHDSCVLRHFSKHKSSHLRFLAWVAYTRKYADESITNEERRTCPLLWCRMEFVDQEAMLKHVWNCPHLSKGLYWCFHCQKHERLGKFHKRCQGLPSRTDRLTNVAKKIFSKLGAGNHRKASHAPTIDASFALSDSWKSRDLKSSKGYPFENPPDWDYPHIQELPDTSICPEMAGDWTAACQELPDSSILEMMGTECTTELGNGLENYPDNFYAESFDDCNAAPINLKTKMASPKLPRLDTSMSPLNAPSRWENAIQTSQQVSPSSGSDGTFSSSIVSPLSAIGTFNPNNALDISPTDSEASGQSFFSDSGYTSATSQSVWDASTTCFSRVPSFNEPKGTKRSWECAAIEEENRNDVSDAVAPILFPVSIPQFDQAFTESLNSTPSVSRSSSNASDKSRAKELSPHWTDAPTLVQSFSEVLDAHISHTKDTLRQMPSNSITSELLAMSKTSLVSIGIEVLAGVLEGRHPTAIVQIFAFTHIACACAISMNHDSDQIRTQSWFQDSLSWISGLASVRQRQLYAQIATSIWQPLQSSEEINSTKLSLPVASPNSLLLACQHFLDILESFNNQQKASLEFVAPNSSFNFAQLSFEFKAKSRVVDKLITMNTIEAFIADVVGVEKRLQQGRISNVRELELELICAGKLSSQSDIAYTRFLGHVTRLCDELYTEESGTAMSRTAYHIRDISLIKEYLPEETYIDEEHFRDDVSDLDIQLDEDLPFDLEFDSTAREIEVSVAEFSKEADEVLNLEYLSSSIFQQPPKATPAQTASLQPPANTPNNPHTPHLSSNTSALPSRTSTPKVTSQSTTQTPNKYRCHCGYTPSGEERWKASNLRRHKRTQHSAETKVYKCRWPGCKSEFTRSDNLRSHQRDKGHVVGVMLGELGGAEDKEAEGESEEGMRIGGGRLLKRRKVVEGEGRGS